MTRGFGPRWIRHVYGARLRRLENCVHLTNFLLDFTSHPHYITHQSCSSRGAFPEARWADLCRLRPRPAYAPYRWRPAGLFDIVNLKVTIRCRPRHGWSVPSRLSRCSAWCSTGTCWVRFHKTRVIRATGCLTLWKRTQGTSYACGGRAMARRPGVTGSPLARG